MRYGNLNAKQNVKLVMMDAGGRDILSLERMEIILILLWTGIWEVCFKSCSISLPPWSGLASNLAGCRALDPKLRSAWLSTSCPCLLYTSRCV